MTRKHGTRNALLLCLAVLAALALLAPTWPGARISLATGSVEVGRGEPPVWKAADEGDALGAGDRVRTGEDGRAEIALEGSTLRLYPNSMLRLPEPAASDTTSVEMDRGTSLFDVLHRGKSSFEVRTPEVVVSVKGTRFGVGVDDDDDAASVAVYRGVVGVRGDAGPNLSETLVHAGFAAHGGGKSLQLSWHGGDDPWESWGQGGPKPGTLGHGKRREATLRDARMAALAMTRDLPPSKGDTRKHEGQSDKPLDPSQAGPAHIAEPLIDPAVGTVRDFVSDAGEELEHDLEESFAENLVNDLVGGDLLTITFIEGSGGSGPDRVLLEQNGGNYEWTFEKSDVENMLDGDDSIPSNLANLLDTQDNQTALLNQLNTLFD